MRNIEKYIAETANHIPERYCLICNEIKALVASNGVFDAITKSFYLGFEAAYRAARAGNLDFQQK